MTDVMTKEATDYRELLESVKQRRKGEPAWLSKRRDAAIDHFAALGFPTLKDEDWRFTDLSPVSKGNFGLPNTQVSVSADDLKPFTYDGLEGNWLVFVNGYFRPALSKIEGLPTGVIACPLSEAIQKHGELVEKYYGRHTEPEKRTFTALNEALAEEGFFLYVPKNKIVEQPIHLIYLATKEAEGTVSTLRNLWIFEESSHARLLETHGATGSHSYFKNGLTEIFTGENANFDHYVIQRESTQASRIWTTHLYQERSSVARSHTLDFGGNLVRHNLWGKLDGEGCEAILNGLYVLRGKQHVDNFMWVEHIKENIPSHELYKGILDDESSAVFTGRIYVHKEAQKTDAKQTNQNLLLSDTAKINTKPQLEIYADDVKCTHGATVGQLDKTAQFYCESRGIDKETARKLLVHAFASDIVERIKLAPVREKVEDILTSRLDETESLRA